MKVLHLFKNYYPPTRGGVEQWLNDIVHSVFGYESTVLTASLTNELVVEDDRGVEVIRAPTALRASTAPIAPTWPSWIRKISPDLVHVHMPNPTQEFALMLASLDVPVVAHYHADIVRSWPVPQIYELFARSFLKKVKTVAVGSPRLAETTPLLQGVADRVKVIPYGVDPEAWDLRPRLADEIRSRHEEPLAVFLGRLVHYKGAVVAVEAMKHVTRGHLLVVGDGPERERAEAAARDHGVTDCVTFCGEVSDEERLAYLHAADVFVFPGVNRGESYGIAQVQAMATGTPSISTELGTGTSWVNQHGETGLVVPPSDAAALGAAIRELLEDDHKRREMGIAAKRRVREHLSREKMLSAIGDMYAEALSG